MVHKPKHKVHSFRGLLGDGGQDEIHLERSNVNLAYRIVKLEIMPNNPGVGGSESVVKVYKEEQSSVDGVIDFTDMDLLAAGYQKTHEDTSNPGMTNITTFDNVLFSRNIYVTGIDMRGILKTNYYIEIEEVPVGAATLMQLKLGVARKLNLSESAPDA